MTNTNTGRAALGIAKEYFEAMANKDVPAMIKLVNDNVAVYSPLGDLVGIQAFQGFSDGFAKMIKKLTLVAAFGDDQEAVIVYESSTLPVESAFVAEHIIVENGKITSTRVIYDGIPFAQYASQRPQH